MRDLTDLEACYQRLRVFGYSARTAARLARWACDPSQPLNPSST